MIAARKALLTTAFEALGPERVTLGLTATGQNWSDCFLAIATDGEANLLRQELKTNLLRWELKKDGRTDAEDFVSSLIGVSVEAVHEVVRVWDHDEAAFRALANEWLELNRAAGRVAGDSLVRPAGGEPAASTERRTAQWKVAPSPKLTTACFQSLPCSRPTLFTSPPCPYQRSPVGGVEKLRPTRMSYPRPAMNPAPVPVTEPPQQVK